MKYDVDVTETCTYRMQVVVGPDASLSLVEHTASAEWRDLSGAGRDVLLRIEEPPTFKVVGTSEPQWTPAQDRQARAGHWMVTGTAAGNFRIRADMPVTPSHSLPSFRTDSAADHYVRYLAEQGDELAQAAVAYISHRNQGEG